MASNGISVSSLITGGVEPGEFDSKLPGCRWIRAIQWVCCCWLEGQWRRTTCTSPLTANHEIRYQETKPLMLYSNRKHLLWNVSIIVKHLICANNMINFSKTQASPSCIECLTTIYMYVQLVKSLFCIYILQNTTDADLQVTPVSFSHSLGLKSHSFSH